MPEREQINRRIESQMVLKGLSRETVSGCMGISYQSFGRKLLGETPWKDTEIVLLARLLEVSTDYLLKGE